MADSSQTPRKRRISWSYIFSFILIIGIIISVFVLIKVHTVIVFTQFTQKVQNHIDVLRPHT